MSKARATWRAKIFRSSGSQAVRLPKDCCFPDGPSEVSVRREGNKLILEPLDEWPEGFFDKISGFEGEIDRPPDEGISTLRNPFESGRTSPKSAGKKIAAGNPRNGSKSKRR